jgi:hypothetical protein
MNAPETPRNPSYEISGIQLISDLAVWIVWRVRTTLFMRTAGVPEVYSLCGFFPYVV